MRLDNPNAFTVLSNYRVQVNDLSKKVMMNLIDGGDPVSGGAILERQDGDQKVMRALKVDYPDPQVHDKLTVEGVGVLRMKQRFDEGEYWGLMVTGTVRGRHEL